MKTHRERAEEAAALTHLLDGTIADAKDIIAEETYPTELVKAATNASCVIQDALEGNSMPTQEDLSDLCAALALYDPPGEPGKEAP